MLSLVLIQRTNLETYTITIVSATICKVRTCVYIIRLGVIHFVLLQDAAVTPMIRNKEKYSKRLINIPPASLEK